MFLLLVVLVLLLYNINYLPKQSRIRRLEQEINMWTQRVTELTDSLQQLSSADGTGLSWTFRFDELFVSPESLGVSVDGKTKLREIASQLKTLNSKFEITGYADGPRPPDNLRWRTNWEYSAAAATAVAKELVNLGVTAERLLVCGAGDTRPRTKKGSADVMLLEGRVEISVRSR
ncbi:MAG: OmpA/MotB family protein [bacterium]